jgi:hypothetical protein
MNYIEQYLRGIQAANKAFAEAQSKVQVNQSGYPVTS